SYTYFTWKNTKAELAEYMSQVIAWNEFYRPNAFVNTQDILHEYLQVGGPPAFEARLVLAATLVPTYGIYSGFESYENVPLRPGSEEYLDSEKYEAKQRTLDGPLLPLVQRLNDLRRAHAALQRADNLRWLETENDPLWFKTAVFYEIHLRGFFDGDDDGSGDFRGLTDKLDYLQEIGVDCIWLLPFYPSPLRDGGYDISDFYAIHPDYGTIDDFRFFIDQAHQRGLRVTA